uniref:Fibroblast growth factor n=1 Tax=Macrostomum lignano TaxID=282301 RepID=A0A1I8FLQ8_9PLAT
KRVAADLQTRRNCFPIGTHYRQQQKKTDAGKAEQVMPKQQHRYQLTRLSNEGETSSHEVREKLLKCSQIQMPTHTNINRKTGSSMNCSSLQIRSVHKKLDNRNSNQSFTIWASDGRCRGQYISKDTIYERRPV